MAVAPAEPCTISIAARRTLPAAVLANTVRAGAIASRNGSAIVTPMPRRTVRREMCFCVIYIVSPDTVVPKVPNVPRVPNVLYVPKVLA
jgi:hypothetical protein